jgi:hypothetical protein
MNQVNRRAIGAVLLALLLAVLPLGRAVAQDASATSDWSFQITPYLWLAGIGGDVTTPSRSLSVLQSKHR